MKGVIFLNEEPYINFVLKEADKKGKIFIIDSGEGNDFIDEKTGWYVEDFSGWLIQKNQVDLFLKTRTDNNAYEVFGDDYVFAKWIKNGDLSLTVEFVKYPSW